MTGAEIFTTIAQLAVGVTGFSGIVIAFNRQPGRLSEFEAFRILIPFALHYMNWSDIAVWRIGNASVAVFEFVFVTILVRLSLRFLRQYRELFNLFLLSFFVVGHAVNGVAQLFSALGWVDLPGLSIFLFGLLWLLFHSAFQFGRIIFVQPMTSGKYN
jgi:hypothetical protein